MAATGHDQTTDRAGNVWTAYPASTSVQSNSAFAGDSCPDIELFFHEGRELLWRRSFCFEPLAGKLSPYIGDLQDEI